MRRGTPFQRAWPLVVVLFCAVADAQQWTHYGGDAGETHYSPLTGINRENVRNPRPAWEWKPGEVPLPEFKTITAPPAAGSLS